MLPDITEKPTAATLLAAFRETYARRREQASSQERMKLTRDLELLEAQIRAAVKETPVPEPLGLELLATIAQRMTDHGYGIFSGRLTKQHFRHPLSIPFTDIDHVRNYVSANLDETVIAKIPELNPKKKLFGLF